MLGKPPLDEYRPLRTFLDDAHHNTKVVEQDFGVLFQKLDAISRAYSQLIGLLDFSSDWFLVFFVLRSHSSFLAGATLATSTQVPDSYGAARSVLENTIYAFYLWRHKDLLETWIKRQEDDDTKKRVRDSFKHGTMLTELEQYDGQYGKVYRQLYEDTIDMGAHPNVNSILSNIEIIEDDKSIVHRLKYFNPDSPIIDLGLKRLCQCGVISQKIYGMIWYDRLKLTDYLHQLTQIEMGL